MQSSFSSGTSTPRLPHPPYRPAKDLPYELREHCIVYFEESLYSQALNLLLILASAGSSTPSLKPAFIPPPQHLALISTLSMHPSFTTRAKTPDKLEAANLALKYLRLLYRTVGPLNFRATAAFAFTNSANSSRRGGVARRRTGEESPEKEKEDAESVDIELANINSLWARADDFWHVVGWAFNCSVAHKKRWERWQMWVEYMLGVLEDDWYDRSEEQKGESLVIRYLNPEDRASVGEKRIVRAVFADGSSRALVEFKEVWVGETRERRGGEEGKKGKVAVRVNVEEDDYGDYMVSSSEEGEEDIPIQDADAPPSPLSPTGPSIDGSLPLGGAAALQLRLRLLALLTAVAIERPDKFTSLRTLYDIYLAHIRPYPLPTFALIVSPPFLYFFSFPSASSLVQYIAASLISSAAPIPKEDDLTQELLEEYFLPWSANTNNISDNAKLGACVETLLRMLDAAEGLGWTENVERCLEEGIRAREGKATKERRRKGDATGGSEGDRAWLRDSGESMRMVLAMARESGAVGE
ncbi:hypothetical protein MMC30_001806 [Trapelia coarctata]|nr:hypothetical protein [Trapelia coarctata]